MSYVIQNVTQMIHCKQLVSVVKRKILMPSWCNLVTTKFKFPRKAAQLYRKKVFAIIQVYENWKRGHETFGYFDCHVTLDGAIPSSQNDDVNIEYS